MSLKEQATTELQSWPAFHDQPRTLQIDSAGDRLHCQFTALDVLACAFDGLALESPRLVSSSIDELKTLSSQLASRLTYLLEPIKPIEIDADQCIVQLRSNPPQHDQHQTSYYELVVRRGGQIALHRYVKEPGDARRTVPATVTREVLLRLIADFEQAVRN